MNTTTSSNFIGSGILAGNIMNAFMENSDDLDDYLDIDDIDMCFEDHLEFLEGVKGKEVHGRRLSLTFMRRLSLSSNAPPREFFQRCKSVASQSYYSHDTSTALVTSSPSVNSLSLLSSAELERQLKDTQSRLAQSMARSDITRRQILSQRRTLVPASALSQSRDQLSEYTRMRGINSRTLRCL
jgi:hypothetical protein